MRSEVPPELLDRASEWDELHRWERSELGKTLRRLGLTYGEIRDLIPVPKSTLSNWCRDVRLSSEQIRAIHDRSSPGSRTGIPVDTQWRRHIEIEKIRSEARFLAESHLDDSRFVGGVVLYWGEGSKTRSHVELSNSDPAALRAFVRWVRRYLDANAEFVLSMHLHEGNSEVEAKKYWTQAVGLPGVRFTKTFIKPQGTGHRKNHLEHGVCRVRALRGGDHWNRIMVWIDVVAACLGPIEDPPC